VTVNPFKNKLIIKFYSKLHHIYPSSSDPLLHIKTVRLFSIDFANFLRLRAIDFEYENTKIFLA